MARRTPRPKMPQMWRVQKLLEWLRSGRKLTCPLAAVKFEVSARTIWNDLECLRRMGAGIEFDQSTGTYRLTEDIDNLPLLALRRSEFAALLVAQAALDTFGDLSHGSLLAGTIQKCVARRQVANQIEQEVRTKEDVLGM